MTNLLKGMLLIIVLWFILAITVNHPVVPFPQSVFKQLVFSFTDDMIYIHLFSSLFRVIMGSFFAILIGFPLGLISGRSKKIDAIISPILYLLYPLPKIAFLPVFMVLLGIGNLSKIALIATIILFPTAVSIRDGVKEIYSKYNLLSRAFHLTKKELYIHVLLPGIIPRLFSSLRVTLGMSLSVLFISENFATTTGLGYYIMNNWIMANYVGMYVGILVLGLLGLTLYLVLETLESRAIPYRTIEE
ncbi:MAG: ABC transporter permease subunit [Spirochaetia bacterium]|nr:ABC transporter permease subunit [Spirochaetia bacterium]